MAFIFLHETIKTHKDRDPAAGSSLAIVLYHPDVHKIVFIKLSHALRISYLFLLDQLASHTSRWLPDIEVKPAVRLRRRHVIDHGTGVVIRENHRDRVTIVSSGRPRCCSFRLVQSTARSLLGRAFDPETMPCDDDCGPGPRSDRLYFAILCPAGSCSQQLG
jgi:hypothetical protein